MSEVRKDLTTGRVTIYAPGRAERPRDRPHSSPGRPRAGEYSPTCPFCPGNEASLARIILEVGGEGGTAWQTRVVANRYPALSPEVPAGPVKSGGPQLGQSPDERFFENLSAHGHHEVLIESRFHDADLARPPGATVRTVIETFHARHLALMEDARVRTIILYRNYGTAAGTTLHHPHSQIIASALIPPDIERRISIAGRYADAHGRCLYCDLIERERREGVRVIGESNAFIAFVPFAAATPCEVWIVPKRHQPSFDDSQPEERAGLADILRDMATRLHRALDDPDYNLVLTSLPGGADGDGSGHWYLAIHPRLITLGGFEIGAGMTINPSLPEQDAELLRTAR